MGRACYSRHTCWLRGPANSRVKLFHTAVPGAAFCLSLAGHSLDPLLDPRGDVDGERTHAGLHGAAQQVASTPCLPSCPRCAATARPLLGANALALPIPTAHPIHMWHGSVELGRGVRAIHVQEGWLQASRLPASIPPCLHLPFRAVPPPRTAAWPSACSVLLPRSAQMAPVPQAPRPPQHSPAFLPSSLWHRSLRQSCPSRCPSPVVCALTKCKLCSGRAISWGWCTAEPPGKWQGGIGFTTKFPERLLPPKTQSPCPWCSRSLTPSSCQVTNW